MSPIPLPKYVPPPPPPKPSAPPPKKATPAPAPGTPPSTPLPTAHPAVGAILGISGFGRARAQTTSGTPSGPAPSAPTDPHFQAERRELLQRFAGAARNLSQGVDADRGGLDPRGVGKAHLPYESEVARTLEEQNPGLRLARRTTANGSGDWVDQNGKSWDAVGIPPEAAEKFAEGRATFRPDSFVHQIDRHLGKVDRVPVDTRGMAPEHVAAIDSHIQGLSSGEQARIIRIRDTPPGAAPEARTGKPATTIPSTVDRPASPARAATGPKVGEPPVAPRATSRIVDAGRGVVGKVTSAARGVAGIAVKVDRGVTRVATQVGQAAARAITQVGRNAVGRTAARIATTIGRSAVGRAAARAAPVIGSVARRVAVPVAAALDAYRFATAKDKVKTSASIAGGWAGAAVGAKGGAVIGAAIGSVIPGAGTAVGAVVGGLVGGAAGYMAGAKLGEKAVDLGRQVVNSAPVKAVTETVGKTVDGAKKFLGSLNPFG